ncbi:hypothetical protein IQ268_25195 [Oculatella sp. LEGE 06141]|uniref:hypothetical protein n=1 Tax=Oculatella sp. LEGE 06141 TaxID=1828648 RepID=UPI00187F7699|nr:hypothetical protein [Oculatella sp. LEGE 06141]MBE9181869.1 hypothetical protein [Oculatella sp. LEGE 06141]
MIWTSRLDERGTPRRLEERRWEDVSPSSEVGSLGRSPQTPQLTCTNQRDDSTQLTDRTHTTQTSSS